MIELRESSDVLGDADGLGTRLREDSYLFFRGLLPKPDVLALRRELVTTLSASGWLADGADPMDAVASPVACPEVDADPGYFDWYARVQALQPFHELAHNNALVGVARDVLGEAVLVHPRKIGRAALPSSETAIPTPPHQDFPLIQGATDTLTAWVPFGDYPREIGGLRVLVGSTAWGLKGVRLAAGVGGVEIDANTEDAGEWASTEFRAGDVLFFHSLTVHGALPNRTDRLRLSADYRFQRLSDPVTADSLRPHYPDYVPAYEQLTEGWSSRASVETPADVVLGQMGDVFDPALPHAASDLLG